MRRSSLRRLLALAVTGALLCLSALLTSPVLAAPETPEVRLDHGALTFDTFLRPGSQVGGPTVEYGATDRIGLRAQWSDGLSLAARYELNPNLALEGYLAPDWDGGLGEAEYGFGLFTGERFGPLYASLRWREAGFPVNGLRIWLNQIVAAGSYTVLPRLSLLGSVTATLAAGTDWQGSYGLEWQVTPAAAVYVNRFTGDDLTQIGAEYRF